MALTAFMAPLQIAGSDRGQSNTLPYPEIKQSGIDRPPPQLALRMCTFRAAWGLKTIKIHDLSPVTSDPNSYISTEISPNRRQRAGI
jgi:hypothetical protein